MKIIVRSDLVNTREGNSSRTGKAYKMRTQGGAIDNGADFPHPIRIPLDDQQPPYPPGEYVLTDDSFTVGEYGDPQISRFFKLLRLAVPAGKQPA